MSVFVPENANELRDLLLRDLRLGALQQDPNSSPPVEPGTDWFLFASASANMGMLSFANISFNNTQSDYQTAEEPRLDDFRRAEGLPPVVAAPSTGRLKMTIIGTPTTVPGGLSGRLPSNRLVFVDGTQTGIADGQTVAAITEVGSDTEFAAGTVVEWINPPPQIGPTAEVSEESPLTGGQDDETPARKRARIANSKRFPANPGGPGQLRADAFNALATVQQAYVFPALGGPSTEKVVILKAFSPNIFDFSRALTDTATDIVRTAIHNKYPPGEQHVVQSVAEEPVDVAITADLPDAPELGGPGNGWLNAVPWPFRDGDTRIFVTVLAPTSDFDIQINALTTTAPIDGQTFIAWYSPGAQRFYIKRVVFSGGGTGAWNLKLDSPLVDDNENAVAVGDFICPGMVNAELYGLSWVQQLQLLGCGENTADPNRLPRSLRLPFQNEQESRLTNVQLLAMSEAHPEIISPAYSFRSQTDPSVPANVDLPPNVLTPQHFAIYPA